MENNHAAIYVRISQDDGEKVDVLSDHRNQLIRLANGKGYTYDLYEEVMSGEKLSNRLEIQRLLKGISKYVAVLVMDLDRLSRDDLEASQIKQLLYMNDVLIITPMKEYDLDNDSDETLFSFQSLIAKMELKQIRKRFKRGKLEGARQGKWTNGAPPFGYRINEVTKKLDIVEEEAFIIREMKELALKGYPMPLIARKLNIKGYRTRTDKEFSGSLIRSMLLRKTYQGFVVLKNKDKRGRVKEEIKCVSAHEPIITEEEYSKIREIFSKRKIASTGSKTEVLSALQGLLFCTCGAKLGFQTHHNSKNPYVKLRECHHTTCNCSGIKAAYVEDSIIELLQEYTAQLEGCLKDTLIGGINTKIENINSKKKYCVKKIDKLIGMKKRLLHLHLEDRISVAEYDSENHFLEEEIKKEEIELYLLEEEMNKVENMLYIEDSVKGYLELFSKMGDIEKSDLNMFYKSFIKKIVYYREIPKNNVLKGIPIQKRYDELLKRYPPKISVEFY